MTRDEVLLPLKREDCNIDWMRDQLPADAISVADRIPPERERVLGWLSDPRVSIYFDPAVVWRTSNHPGNPDDWWTGLPGSYMKLNREGWKLSHWMRLPTSRGGSA